MLFLLNGLFAGYIKFLIYIMILVISKILYFDTCSLTSLFLKCVLKALTLLKEKYCLNEFEMVRYFWYYKIFKEYLTCSQLSAQSCSDYAPS